MPRTWYWTRERLTQLMECVQKVCDSTEGKDGTIIHSSGLAQLVFPHYTQIDPDAHLTLMGRGLYFLTELDILDKGKAMGGRKVRHFTPRPITDEMVETLKPLRKS